MYSQRAGVAGSPEVHFVLTSSLSATLNGMIPSRRGQVQCMCLLSIRLFISLKGSIREDAIRPGWYREKMALFSPIILLICAVLGERRAFFDSKANGGGM